MKIPGVKLFFHSRSFELASTLPIHVDFVLTISSNPMWLFALPLLLALISNHGYFRARCHAVTEVAIIASNRQLSKLHPIYQLMAPHYRYTLQVNSGARFDLLSAGGAIEQIYTPGEYVFAMASAYYRDYWTFASNALPNDLIKRQVRWIHYLAQWVSEWVSGVRVAHTPKSMESYFQNILLFHTIF